MQKTFKYPKDEITVVWKPDLCIHCTDCVQGLPGVFDYRRRPWIDTSQAETQQIIDQVNKCPSGALSIINSELK
jgi:uncharacterized Fe-S cluster protein YjdI